MNVYQMIVENGGPGFWVRRITWGPTIARVVGVGEFTGKAPYYGNPVVLMDVYSTECELKSGLAEISTPGSYKTWRLIEVENWPEDIPLRPLDDPAILEAVLKSKSSK